MKATYCEINGVGKEIFKDPKTVVGMPKKSLRGLIEVINDADGNIIAVDRVSTEAEAAPNLLETVFEDGKLVKEITLDEVRKTHMEYASKVVENVMNA